MVATVTGSVHVAAAATAAVVGGGIGLATLPVRGAAGVVAGLSDVHSPGALVAEFVGGPPVRRCSRGTGRAWIELRGLHDPQRGRAIAEHVVSALNARPGVTSAKVNFPLSRVVVSLGRGAPTIRELCAIVEASEGQNSSGAVNRRLIDLPGDPEVLAGRLVSLAAASAGLGVALAGRALLWVRLPAVAAAAPIVVDYQPRLRRRLEDRFGPSVTDTGLAVATAAAYTATQAWSSLAVDLLLQLSRTVESRSHRRAWAQHEAQLAAQAACANMVSAPRPRPLPPGPVERHGDRSALAQIVGATAIGAATRNVNMAATAALVAAPKAIRTARECFASTLARGLCDDYGVLALRPAALRRLDRVDAVLVDPRALSGEDLRVSRIRGAPDRDRAAVWQWAHDRLPSLPIGWNAVGGPWATNGNGRSSAQVFVRRAHQPLASAVIGEARRSGAAVVSLDVDELDDLRSTFDDLEPVTGDWLDAALADAVVKMQRDGRTVLVLSNSAAQALSAADVAVGVLAPGAEPPWYAHLIVDDLAAAWRLVDHHRNRPRRRGEGTIQNANIQVEDIFRQRTPDNHRTHLGETRRRVKVIGRLPGEHSAPRWYGPCWTAPQPAGACSPSPRLGYGYWPTCATHCTTRQPSSTNPIRHPTPKPASHQPIPPRSHNITNERDPHQATFTPLPGRNRPPGAEGWQPSWLRRKHAQHRWMPFIVSTRPPHCPHLLTDSWQRPGAVNSGGNAAQAVSRAAPPRSHSVSRPALASASSAISSSSCVLAVFCWGVRAA